MQFKYCLVAYDFDQRFHRLSISSRSSERELIESRPCSRNRDKFSYRTWNCLRSLERNETRNDVRGDENEKYSPRSRPRLLSAHRLASYRARWKRIYPRSLTRKQSHSSECLYALGQLQPESGGATTNESLDPTDDDKSSPGRKTNI